LLSGEFGIEKPDARIFEKALKLGKIGTINKEERSKQILHIGDDEARCFDVLP
jgi:FMN phosphatase YigB (HAD superfamily)